MTEVVPAVAVVWQSDSAQTIRCPYCHRWLFTQHEGDDAPTHIECKGPMESHTVEWAHELPVA